MILHAMFENGAVTVRDLDRYIRDDVERVGQKLRDVDKKLRQAMEDQVRSRSRYGPLGMRLISGLSLESVAILSAGTCSRRRG
jgi:hypothetical protein